MISVEVPAGEYIIFAHPIFDYETMSQMVIEKVNETVQHYDMNATEYE